jgi:3-phosphoshikimate 1-carboxyvinyltransferase
MSDVERVAHAARLRGSVRVPGDKSSSHRALMISALASGESSITGLSSGDDVAATSVILEQLGATRHDEDGVAYVRGPLEGLHPASGELDCENSGTTMRLMSGIVGSIAGTHQLMGDASLSRRPMDRIATPLGLMGIEITGNGPTTTPPLSVRGPERVHAIEYYVPVASAQVKSAILLAGLFGDGPTHVREDVRTRRTTEDMLCHAGIGVESVDVGEGRTVTVLPGRPRRRDWHVPGDPSQAAFFAVLGAIHSDASLEVLSVDSAPERVGFVSVLQRMGASVSLTERDSYAVLRTKSSSLVATEIHSSDVPSVDEVPILSVAACAASGVSAFRSMNELRHKESDRFAGSLALATLLGCRAWEEGDDFFIEGLGSAERFNEFTISTSLDHRMVMASAVAGCAGHGATIEGASSVTSSYPHFFRDLTLLQ